MRLHIGVLIVFFFFLPKIIFAAKIERVEPKHWWVGMQNKQLQLLIYGKDIGRTIPKIIHKHIKLESVDTAESPNYLFLNLLINTNAQAGAFEIHFTKKGEKVIKMKYELKERRKNSSQRQGFSSADAIYLLMPDRFANGNPNNDNIPEMLEKANRKTMHGRHGGDIEGIIQHLDYIEDLGITALWTTPMMEDNLAEVSYHHYAISDYYKIDPRFGTNADYKRLASEAKRRGIKLIMDVVTNHCSTAHWWMQDLPYSYWVHQFPEFTRTNYRMSTLTDPHASQKDKLLNSNGWFDYTMPDMNQKNSKLLTYFTQLFIWWIEYADLGGLRIDTFPYNDIHAMAQFNKSIMEEYPNFNIVGECWQQSPQEIAYWQKDKKNHDGYNSEMPTVMDFPFRNAIKLALNEKSDWTKGMARLYQTFSLDYVYENLNNLMIFIDNHDTERFAAIVKEDPKKMKLALTLLSTIRGIPQIYYGTEIMMTGDKKKGDGDIRRDFPGGWKEDSINAFLESDRDSIQNDIHNHLRKLLHYRKNNKVLHTGKMTHFIPEEDVYVYFRHNTEKTIMICLNNSKQEKTIRTKRFAECIKNTSSGTNIITSEIITNLSELKIPAKGNLVIELNK